MRECHAEVAVVDIYELALLQTGSPLLSCLQGKEWYTLSRRGAIRRRARVSDEIADDAQLMRFSANCRQAKIANHVGG